MDVLTRQRPSVVFLGLLGISLIIYGVIQFTHKWVIARREAAEFAEVKRLMTGSDEPAEVDADVRSAMTSESETEHIEVDADVAESMAGQ